MSLYTLLKNRTTTNTVPDANLVVQPTQGQLGQPSSYQAFTATVTGTGAVTATVQPVVSNDGVNWSNFGSAISLSGTNSATGNASLQGSFAYWGAIVTAITGTGASVNALLSA